jgi:outer membrane protein OmpA-like peptidoglycan-associated protein
MMKNLPLCLFAALAICLHAPAAHAQASKDSAATILEDNTNLKKPGGASVASTEGSQSGKPSKKTNEKPLIKNDDNLFEKQKRAWAVELHGGYPFLQSDIAPSFGVGYGLNIRKALGYAVSLRLDAVTGYATGQDYKLNGWSYLQENDGYNGKNNPKSDYYDSKLKVYNNYKMTFTKVGIEGIYNFNNLSFMSDRPRLSVYVFGGIGGLLYNTYVDALDANGNMYNYESITRSNSYSDRKTTLKQLKQLQDGTYETAADGTNSQYGQKLFNKNFTPITTAGLGVGYKISNMIAAFAEVEYGFTGKDNLDGQRWFNPGVPTAQPDAWIYTNVGVSFKLSRSKSISWYDNPLSVPYQTILDNKKKLQKLNDLGQKVDDLSKKVDTAQQQMDSLTADSDGDGVSNYFDNEDNTPAGAIVDGAGRTIFYRNDNGDLVFNDPNYSQKSGSMPDGTPTAGNGDNANGNANGSNSGNNYGNNSSNGSVGDNGNSYGQGNTANNGSGKTSGKKGKYTFNKNDPNGKTVIFKNNGSNNNYNYNSSGGTNTSIGFLPAVFFESNSAELRTASYSDLYEIARMLKNNPNAKVNVVGYTDYRNTEAYNKALGKRRAEAVVYALTKYFGVPTNQLVATTEGEHQPLTDVKSSGGLAANRRVQFEIEGSSASLKGDFNNPKPVNKPADNKKSLKSRTTPAPDETVKEIIDQSKPVEDNKGN